MSDHNLLSRAPPCFGKHVQLLVRLHSQSLPLTPVLRRVDARQEASRKNSCRIFITHTLNYFWGCYACGPIRVRERIRVTLKMSFSSHPTRGIPLVPLNQSFRNRYPYASGVHWLSVMIGNTDQNNQV
jgi:hypothetical protein